ncbi:MAG: 4-(cytidine 5'-diphospho)-2-C-methyl-D-erythritol kinase, partial [Nitriliruptorales bacterium]
ARGREERIRRAADVREPAMRTEPGPLDAVRVRVPAKVNLFLAVRGRRDDGMHELVSIMQTVGLRDELTAAFSGSRSARFHPASRKTMKVVLEEPGEGAPDGEQNLAVQAAALLAEQVGIDAAPGDARTPNGPATILHLTKRIPVAAGMAGGSADAAAALVALNRLWNCEQGRDALREVAGRLGADVPFCVTGGTALATGTGIATAQVLCRGVFHWTVGISAEPLSTADVYRAWDELFSPSEVEPDIVLQALRTGDVEALGAGLHNDLEGATFHLRPELEVARDAMLAAGALGVIVSGSGPTLVALAEDGDRAEAISRATAEHFARTEVASSPAGGPELLPA